MSDAIRKEIELKAPVGRVWEALTDSAQFGEWFRVKFDRPFTAGEEASGQILHPGYGHLTWRAVIKAIEPKTRFAFTWHPYGIDPKVDYSAEEPTLVEFLLRPLEDGGTHLTLIESGFDKVPAHRREEAFRMNSNGWTQQMKNIEAYVGR